jgi:transposase
MLNEKIREQGIGPRVHRSTLWRLLKKIGYSFTAIDNRVHLIERNDLREWRKKFIQYINQNNALGSQARPVVYLDESWIDCHATAKKGWKPKVMKRRRDKLDHCLKRKSGKGARLIMLHAGTKDGFINHALLLKSSKTTDEDYHAEMDSFGFENWFRSKLLPNIPANSIIVMDNAPYHSTSDRPKSKDRVQVMKDWLKAKNIPFPEKAIKKELWALIKGQSKNPDHYFIDKLAKEFGHDVVRLPPYHCDLNPIELVWGHVKEYVAKYNTTGKVDDIVDLAHSYMEAYPPETWAANVEHCRK